MPEEPWYATGRHLDWRYELTTPMRFQLPPVYTHCAPQYRTARKQVWDLYTADHADWAYHPKLATCDSDGKLTIFPGFAWDGATCAPDFQKCLRATLIHDLMCQAARSMNWPYTRDDADEMLLDVALEDGFLLAPVYYQAVKWFGRIQRLARKLPLAWGEQPQLCVTFRLCEY